MRKSKNVTIKDIAKALGLSPSTVSRALNNYSDINPETRDKVIEMAKKLNYVPNIFAKGLVTNKTKRVGLFIEDLEREGIYGVFYYEILTSFRKAAMDNGYEVVLLSTTSEEQKRVHFDTVMQEKQLEGAFIMGLKTDDEYLNEIQKSTYPVVLLDIPIKNSNIGYVTTDNLKGAQIATEHLIHLGHRRIGFLNGHKKAYVSQERLNGYILALSKNGIRIDNELIVEGDFTEESGYKAADYFLEKGVTAVFAASDMMAIGLIKRFKDLGVEVPAKVSIVGFDDVSIARYITPTLTTIRQNKSEMGKSAFYLLLNLISKQPINHIVLEPDLVKRESTARLR
ncbi:LacI family DNA-binding transcriptional regulator [Caldicellulosiruptor naganoensis]|uniref:LacI family transcriptional regulator n=2 Tax=Caldicellulosiruptor naganoensis TaxID=29324 RepID=A0ABY7BGZ5_9FIRM|nr:LacI family DNA-binding transcriptional regulator [Caldicellulosiruptor naganoensis]WAM31859.1 LacI family transcriptional regulator [Caldicellulosiruptor naganoensis]